MAKSNWQRDFPVLSQFSKRPLFSIGVIAKRLLVHYEKITRWIIILGTFLLMLFIISKFLNLGLDPTTEGKNVVETYTIQTYKAYRNFFYMIWVISILPLLTLSVIYWVKDGFSKFLRLFLTWWGVLLFVTFSYAAAKLISEFVWVMYYLHQGILEVSR